jgi:hypothetical protein
MIKYLCTDCEDGTGNMMLDTTPEGAFIEYKAYFDNSATFDDVYIFKITSQLQGVEKYEFTEVVGT